MRIVPAFLAMFLCGSVLASDLTEAEKLLAAKSYPQAVQLLTRLAESGDAAAQLRLGQVYWYGEGVAVDRARGDALFARSAALGNAEAVKALAMTGERARHAADIAYWTARYDGADLTSGKFACKAPSVPRRSTDNAEIKATSEAMQAWRTCYNGFVDHIAEAMPLGKRIPADVADLLSDPEMEQAKAHLEQVYKRVLAEAKVGADRTLADYDAWEKSTAAYVVAENAARLARQKAEQAEIEVMRNRVASQPRFADPQPRGGAR
jgi:TPR repeat protein